MVNKLWYKQDELGELYNDINLRHNMIDRSNIQNYIDLYCYGSFKITEDITPDNLQLFIEIILKQYQIYNISLYYEMSDLVESVNNYLRLSYYKEFPEGVEFPDDDRRSLSLFVLGYCMEYWVYDPFPEDVPFILKCLNCPEEDIVNMKEKLGEYFNQFDNTQRKIKESTRRWEAIKRERIEALEKGEPLPIRPMSIELDPCYKK